MHFDNLPELERTENQMRGTRNFPAAFRTAILLAAILLAASCVGGPERAPVPEKVPDSALSPREREIRSMESLSDLLSKGDFTAAESRLRALIAEDPGKNEYRILLSSVLVSAGKVPEARAAAAEAVSAAPADPGALMAVVQVERYSGDDKALRAALDKVLAVDPANAEALAAYGDSWYAGKNYTKAEELYRKSVASDPQNLSGLLGLGRTLLRRDKPADAELVLNQAVQSHPASSQARADRSRVLYRRGKYVESLSDLDEAVRLDPAVAWYRIERGRFRMDLGRLDEARADFDEAIRLDPDYFLPYVYRAGMLEQAGRDEESRADYRKITALYPDYWYAFESIGVTSFRLGDFPAAREGFEKALSYSPGRMEYGILAVISAYRAGQDAEGKALAARYLARVSRETHNLHWLILRLLQDRNDAVSELETKIPAEKSLDTRAEMLFYLGQYWMIQGKASLGARYLLLVKDMGREGILEHRLAEKELERIAPKP